MTRKRIVLLSLTLLICSCSTIRLKSRKGLDIHLDTNSFNKLSGNFKNIKNDSIKYHKTLLSYFKNDSLYRKIDLIINIIPVDKNKILLKVIENQSLIDSISIQGKYRRGYFKMKRQFSTNYIAGPLLWTLGDNLKYLGLTKEDKLVIIDTGSGGIMLIVAFPIFGAGSGQFENEYERTN